jgi:hypothetical protein
MTIKGDYVNHKAHIYKWRADNPDAYAERNRIDTAKKHFRKNYNSWKFISKVFMRILL